MGFNPVQKMCKDQVVGGTVGGWRLVIWTTMYTSMVNPPPPKSKVLMVNWKLWVMSWSALRLVKIFAFSITVGTFESNSCVCEYQMILMGFYQAYFTDINCQKVYSQQDGKTQLIFKRGLALSGRLFQMKPIYNLLEPFEFTFPGHVFLWPMDRYNNPLPFNLVPYRVRGGRQATMWEVDSQKGGSHNIRKNLKVRNTYAKVSQFHVFTWFHEPKQVVKLMEVRKKHMSNEKNTGWLGYIGDYTTQV